MMKQILWDGLASGPKHTLYGTQLARHFLTLSESTQSLMSAFSVDVIQPYYLNYFVFMVRVNMFVCVSGISQSERMKRAVKTLSEGRGVAHRLLPLKPPLEMPRNRTSCGMVWKYHVHLCTDNL